MTTTEPVRVVSCDLDGTLLGHPEATGRFNRAWYSLPLGIRPLLVYNTSRTVADTRALVADGRLPEPDYIFGSLGTDFHAGLYDLAPGFRGRFSESWNLARVEEIVSTFAGIKKQPSEFLNEFKSSWYWGHATVRDVAALTEQIQGAGVQADVVYSCQHFLDIVPAGAGKGSALAWLCQRLGIPLSRVVVAGDTANDRSMFQLPGIRGILVANALAELRVACDRRSTFLASAAMADGVLEGLRHYGVIGEGFSHRSTLSTGRLGTE